MQRELEVIGGFSRLVRQHIAPPRFLAFALLLLCLSLFGWLSGIALQVSVLASFDLATLVFLSSLIPLFNDDPPTMRRTSAYNDANRVILLVITVLVLAVVLVAIGTLVSHRGALWFEVPLILGSLILAWVFANTVFALHYAHLYYQDEGGRDHGGLDFPDAKDPDYWDFFYFSFTLGMTFQTSDVVIKASHIRRVVLAHSMAAFVFNLGVLAFAINTIGSL